MSIFKEAAKLKLRFKAKGNMSVEDLFDLPLTSKDGVSLNDIAKEIYKNIKEDSGVDFVGEVIETDRIEELKLQIVKEIIKDKKDDIKRKEESEVKKSHNENIDKLIAAKEAEALSNLSIEDLKALRKWKY